MALPDRTLCWVEGPPWDRTCEPLLGQPRSDLELLRDPDALRVCVEQLTPVEIGRVLGVVLRRLDQRGDSALPNLLRVLADQVDELQADMERSAVPHTEYSDPSGELTSS